VKIGIPRALYFFKYGGIWEEFFKKLNCEVIISPPTNKEILTTGVSLAVEEVCIPLKVFYGHCKKLEGKCDFVFIPRYISLIRGTYTCPKFLVLPDVTRFLLPDLPILTICIKGKPQPGIFQFLLLNMRMYRKISWVEGKNLFNVKKMRSVFRLIQEKEERKKSDQTLYLSLLGQRGLKVMVVGHPYNLRDTYVSQDLLGKLKSLGVTVITPEQIPPNLIHHQLKSLPFIYWSEEWDIAGSAYLALKEPRIRGIILVSSFGCGPDSLITEQIVRDARKSGKPVMQLFLDENTSDVNIQTRLEAFLDMLERK